MSLNRDLFVVIRLGGNEIGIPVDNVLEMVTMPEVAAVPVSEPFARGIITLRGQAIPLIDLRKYFGISSLAEEQQELIQTLTIREEDHVKWLQELENSVKEKREFKLATDPHKCNFGKWYDNYSTDYLILQSLLPKFDAPHKRIHGIAQQVVEHAAEEQYEAAMEIIEHTRRGDLNTMVKLFGQARQIIQEDQREIALVLQAKERQLSVSVDAISSVETLVIQAGEDSADLLETASNRLLKGIGQSKTDGRLILLINLEHLIDPGTDMLAAG